MNTVRVIRWTLLALSSFVLMGMGSCSEHVEGVCRTKLPEFQKSLAQVQGQLAAPNRSPASSGSNDLPDWAEAQLKEVQYWIDAVDGLPDHAKLQETLNGVANNLVIFHGYAVSGDREKMAFALNRANEGATEIYQTVCK